MAPYQASALAIAPTSMNIRAYCRRGCCWQCEVPAGESGGSTGSSLIVPEQYRWEAGGLLTLIIPTVLDGAFRGPGLPVRPCCLHLPASYLIELRQVDGALSDGSVRNRRDRLWRECERYCGMFCQEGLIPNPSTYIYSSGE